MSDLSQKDNPAVMRVLALDTTHEFGSLALVDSHRGVIEEISLHSPDGFAHVIFGEIEALLARNGLDLKDVDGFASASGPGAFTGVRVGLTVVKGLAEATGRKVVAISNLMALAYFGTRLLRAVVIDARRGEIYGAVYDSALRPVCPEVVAPVSHWLAGLPNGDLELITNGYPIATALLNTSDLPEGNMGVTAIGTSRNQAPVNHLPIAQAPIIQAPQALAGAIGMIALAEFQRCPAPDPSEIDANYVRRADAELLWKDPKAQ